MKYKFDSAINKLLHESPAPMAPPKPITKPNPTRTPAPNPAPNPDPFRRYGPGPMPNIRPKASAKIELRRALRGIINKHSKFLKG